MRRRIFAALLCLCMMATLLPTAALATDEPRRYEAETATLNGSTVVDDAAASGGKYVKITETNQSFDIANVAASVTGNYTVTIRYRAANGEKTNYLSVNGGANQELTFAASSAFTDLETSAALSQGSNIITIQAGWGWIDVDYIEVAPAVQDISNTGLDLSNNAPAAETTYKAGTGTVVWTPAKDSNPATLTFNNATINGGIAVSATNSKAIILPNAPVRVVFNGTNSITAPNKNDTCVFYCDAATTFDLSEGSSTTLNVNGHNATCIRANGAVTVNGDGATLKLNSSGSSAFTLSAGINAVTLNGGTMAFTGRHGIAAGAITINGVTVPTGTSLSMSESRNPPITYGGSNTVYGEVVMPFQRLYTADDFTHFTGSGTIRLRPGDETYSTDGYTIITTAGLDLSTPPAAEITYTAGEGTVTYTPGVNGDPPTLTLSNAAITPTAAVPLVLGSAKLVLIGSSRLRGTGVPALCGNTSGNISAGNIAVGGSGSLLLESVSNTGSLGSFAATSLTLEDTATVTSAGGTVAGAVTVNPGATLNAILKVNGTQTVYGNNIIAKGVTRDYSNEELIWTPGAVIEVNGVLILKQGTDFDDIKNNLTGSGVVRIVTATGAGSAATEWESHPLVTVPLIQLGADGIKINDKVYFGKYTANGTNYDVPWFVLPGTTLSETSVADGTNALPLFSVYSLGFSYYGSGVNYDGSYLKDAMNYIYNGFDLREQTAIADTTLAKGNIHDSVTEDEELPVHKLFPLSLAEAESLIDGNSILQAKDRENGNNSKWWLRTRVNDYSSYIYNLSDFVNQDNMYVYGVRPAMNLSLSSVLFTSAATDGKTGDGTLAPVSTGATDEWKLTLSDAGRSEFSITTTALSSASATFDYSGAQTGANEYISAVIVDNGSVIYYGRIISLPEAEDDSGTVTINLPSGVTLDSDTTLQVFNEQFNGDRSTADNTAMTYTDYASEPITVTPPACTVTLDKQSGTGGDDSVTATYNSAMPAVTPPARQGYTFTGYFDAVTGGTKYYNADGVCVKVWDKFESATLYANWSYNGADIIYIPIYCKMTFISNGGSAIDIVTTAYYNTVDLTLSRFIPTREGYMFTGWYSDEGLTNKVTSVFITGNKTLYAGWTAIPSMDNFKPNGIYGGYDDVDESRWYGTQREGVIRDAALLGIVEGYGDNSFGPENELKISEAIKIACMIHSVYMGDGYDFTRSGTWYDVYVDYAINNGLIKAGDFSDYKASCSRSQAAYIFVKALPVTELAEISELTPPDITSDDLYADEISMLYSAGIFRGNDEIGTFGGDGTFNRAQAAAIITRLVMSDKRIAK